MLGVIVSGWIKVLLFNTTATKRCIYHCLWYFGSVWSEHWLKWLHSTYMLFNNLGYSSNSDWVIECSYYNLLKLHVSTLNKWSWLYGAALWSPAKINFLCYVSIASSSKGNISLTNGLQLNLYKPVPTENSCFSPNWHLTSKNFLL